MAKSQGRLFRHADLSTLEDITISMRYYPIAILLILTCFSCIQTDFRDDTRRTPQLYILQTGKLLIMDSNGGTLVKGSMAFLSLSIGEKQSITTEYLNEFGVKKPASINWLVASPTVASVANNEITALAPGTTFISGSVGDINISISLTVVGNPNAVASVLVGAPSATNLSISQSIQLSATVKNISGTILEGKTIEWFSENTNLLSVNSSGLVTALANGTVEVHAKVEGVKSNSIKFNIGTVAGKRTGTFQSAGGYQSVGSVTVTENGSNLVVELGNDFTASVALGTFIYLANSTTGSNVKSAGLELGQWTPSGTKTFTANGVTLNQYKYVVVLCKPAGVTFGFAELKP